jgi:hypothetical protein
MQILGCIFLSQQKAHRSWDIFESFPVAKTSRRWIIVVLPKTELYASFPDRFWKVIRSIYSF